MSNSIQSPPKWPFPPPPPSHTHAHFQTSKLLYPLKSLARSPFLLTYAPKLQSPVSPPSRSYPPYPPNVPSRHPHQGYQFAFGDTEFIKDGRGGGGGGESLGVGRYLICYLLAGVGSYYCSPRLLLHSLLPPSHLT